MERYANKPNAERLEAERLAHGRALLNAAHDGPKALLDRVVSMLIDEADFWAGAVNDQGKPRKGQGAAEKLRRDAAGLVEHYAKLIGEQDASWIPPKKMITVPEFLDFTPAEMRAPVGELSARPAFDATTEHYRRIAEQYPLVDNFDHGTTSHPSNALQETTGMIRIGGASQLDDEPEVRVIDSVHIESVSLVANPLPHLEIVTSTPPMQPLHISDIATPGREAPSGKAIGGPTPVHGATGIVPIDWSQLFKPVNDALRPEHRSVSQITGYENCPLSYRLQRYAEGISVPGWAMVGGTAFHTAVQEFEAEVWANPEQLKNLIEHWLEDLTPTWERHLSASVAETVGKHPGVDMRLWHASDGGRENYTWWSVEGAVMLQRYLDQRMEWGNQWRLATMLQDKTPAIELAGTHNVGAIPVKYAIDLVWTTYDGPVNGQTFLIDDLKSGRNKPDDAFQLMVYSDAFASIMRGHTFRGGAEEAIEAVYYHARKAERVMRDRYLTPNAAAEIGYRVVAMDTQERAGFYHPRRSSMCVACTVSASCPVGKLGSLRQATYVEVAPQAA